MTIPKPSEREALRKFLCEIIADEDYAPYVRTAKRLLAGMDAAPAPEEVPAVEEAREIVRAWSADRVGHNSIYAGEGCLVDRIATALARRPGVNS